jgi:hypothetical protein
MAIQSPRPFIIDPARLDTSASPSDRFTYLAHFVLFQPAGPAGGDIEVPGYRAAYVARIAAFMPKDVRDQVLKDHPVIQAYAEQLAQTLARPVRAPQAGAGQAQSGALAQAIREVESMLDGVPDPGTPEAAAFAAGLRRLARTGQALLAPAPRSTSPARQEPRAVAVATPADVSAWQQLAMLLTPEIGFLYLDRTRITPIGFTLGEHVYSLSLAPGEEVTLEQRTFSKRETAFEDLEDKETNLDLELSSSLTSELTEGLNVETSRMAKDSETNGFRVSGEIFGVNIAAGPNTSNSVDDGDRTTSTTSVKSTQTAASKVAARYRAQHKTTFRVSTENRFETSSKRVVRNPNAYTAIDLVYFKILQRVRLSQERYGVRLCWSPAVPDPAGPYYARLQALKDTLFAAARQASAGPRPTPPTPPAAAQPITRSSGPVAANKFDWPLGNQNADYDVSIAPPSGYMWDGNAGSVISSLSFSFTGSRRATAAVRGASNEGDGVKCLVHVNIDPQVWVDTSTFPPTGGAEDRGSAFFSVSARFVPSQSADADYNQKLAAWKAADAAWQAQDAQVKADALAKAQSDWDALRAEELAKLDPMNETFGVLIQKMFPAQYRDDIAEIDRWERLFDWPNASLKLYPAWWNGGQLREPSLPPNHFLNASWARLFLPVRIGAEAEALRWIYQLSTGNPAYASIERYIKLAVAQLADYRRRSFGSENEIVIHPTLGGCPPTEQRWLCMGEWEETLPTDGTHIEVLQSTTLAADDDGRARLADAAALRTEAIERQRRDNDLRSTVNAVGPTAVSAAVRVELTDSDADADDDDRTRP